MPLADLVVVEVVGRRDLHGTGAELPLDVLVGDDPEAPSDEWQDRLVPDDVAIAVVVRMHGDCGVAEDRLRPCRGDSDRRVWVRRAVLTGEVVANAPQRPRLFVLDVLEVADRRAAAGAPVHERLAAIREPRLPQPSEGDADGARASVVHREAQPRPVEARTQAPMLHADDVARLVHEAPHAFQVALATKRLPRLALLGDDAVEDELGCDAGVVDTGQPEGVVATHPVEASQDVLDEGGQRVAEVQRAGDVRRRLDDDEALRTPRRLVRGAEGVGLEPTPVDRRLDRRGVVARWELASRRRHRFASGRHKARSSKDERARRGTTFVRTDDRRLMPALSGSPAQLACDLLAL